LIIIKDRIYSYKADSYERRSAQTVIFTLIKEMAIVMSPILSFTADEIWEHIPHFEGKAEFVFFETYPGIIETDKNVLNKIDRLTEIKKEVNKALELARVGKLIGHPLDARVDLYLKKMIKNMCAG